MREHAPAGPVVGVTGIWNSKLGMWAFLASEVLLFGAFVASYLVTRWSQPALGASAQELNRVLAAINTFVLITSSFTMALAVGAIKEGQVARMRALLGATAGLGVLFLILKAVEYGQKLSHGIVPATNVFFGYYYVLTGLHALHVLAGIGVLLGAVILAGRGRYSAQHHDTIENIGLYWHFVDIVWIFLFPLFYLV